MRFARVVSVCTSLAVSALLVGGEAAPAAAVPIASPSLVDDGVYPYPDAAAILEQQNVELLSGDGHILLADCATPPVGDIGLLKVYTTDESIGADGIGRVCFQLNASSGVLNLRVPGVYEIRGDGQRTGTGHEVTAELHSDAGEDLTVAVDPDGSTQVGLGTDPNASPTMLLQLRAGTGVAPVTGGQTAVGKLASDERMCTATLIDPRWVLTTTSCFAADPLTPQLTEGAAPGGYKVVFPGHAAVGVDWVIPRSGRDVTLARLASAVSDLTPLALTTTLAPTGIGLPSYGYGRTTTWVTDQQQSPSITVTGTSATTLGADAAAPVCSGMAGAPVLLGGAVTAILSQGGQAGCLGVAGSDSTVVAARTDDLKTWANAIMATTSVHTWTLADMPAGAIGSAVSTAADTVFTSATPLPLTGSAGAKWATDDTYSPSVVFDGSSGQLTSSTAAVDTTADFTISAWVRPTAAGGTVISQDAAQTAALKLYTDAATMSWRFGMSNSDSATATWSTASAPNNSVQLNQWAHVTIAFKARAGLMMLDVNGVNVATSGHGTQWKATGPLRIGALKTAVFTYGNRYTGKLSYVQMWDTANSAYRTYPTTNSSVYDSRANQTKVYFNSGGTLKEVRFDGTAWQAAQSLNATSVQGIPTAVQNPVTNNIEVYYVAGGNLWQQVFDGTAWTATNFSVAASGQPAVYLNPNNNNVEVYFNSGNVLKERHWSPTGGWAAVSSLGAAIAGSPTAIYNPFNHNTEVYFTSGGNLSEKWYGTAWSSLINLGTPMTGQPTAVYNPNLGNMQIYMNSGGTLKERYWSPASGWSTTAGDLGVTMTGSPSAVYNPILGNIQVYANSAGALKEKFWSKTTGWSGIGDLQSPITNSPWAGYNPGTGAVEVYLNSGGNLKLKAWTDAASWAALLNLAGPISN